MIKPYTRPLNEYMVNWSDVVVVYVLHGWGGAATILRYAERKKKRIVRFPEQQENFGYLTDLAMDEIYAEDLHLVRPSSLVTGGCR